MDKYKMDNELPSVRTNQDFHFSLLKKMKFYFQNFVYKKLPADYYNVYTLITKDDPDRIRFHNIFKQMKQTDDFNPQKLGLSVKQSRAIGSFLGMVICDALGACTEFQVYKKSGHNVTSDGFAGIKESIKKRKIRPRHNEITTWTDDASMGIAIGFSLMIKKYQFDPIHIRYMFFLWLYHGLGNGGRKCSIGLGGNIKISMDEFLSQRIEFASDGLKVKNFNNGNGSLMRLAPIPAAFYKDKEKALEFSALQSKTTHNGFEAEQCCRLMASIIVQMINRDQIQEQSESSNNQKKSWKQLFDKVCKQFTCVKQEGKTVEFLAKSQQQTQQIFQQNQKRYQSFKNFNPSLSDRNWNWKNQSFTYSKYRNQQMPGYIGSYCMDGLAMALHTVWHTSSFKECALLNANMGGDCDTVGSIAGQMAGAIYGISQEMLKLYSEMKDFESERFEGFLMGYKLATGKLQSVQRQFKNEEMKSQKGDKQRQQKQEFREQGKGKRVKKNQYD